MGCCSLDAGKVPQRCLQQIANRLFLDVLFQASATTGQRIPLYLGVHEARTPMFLMRHGCRLTHVLDSYISIVVPTTALTPTPFHCPCMHTWVRHGPRTGVCQDPICLAMRFAWRADTLRIQAIGLLDSVMWDQSAVQHEQPHSFQPSPSSQPAAHYFKQRFLILHKQSQRKHSKLQPST